jgi:hypothetical protein
MELQGLDLWNSSNESHQPVMFRGEIFLIQHLDSETLKVWTAFTDELSEQ